MALTPDDIIEEFIDDLAMGELGQRVTFDFSRTGPGAWLLDYGDLGRFRLTGSLLKRLDPREGRQMPASVGRFSGLVNRQAEGAA